MAIHTTEEYVRFFREADKDKSGSLSFSELTAVFKNKGYNENDLKGFFRSVDIDGDNQISEQEFLEAMGCAPPELSRGAAMRMIFREFDKDGNGSIDKSELKTVFQEMGKHFSDQELSRMVQLMDADGSGTINYEEFISHFCGQKE